MDPEKESLNFIFPILNIRHPKKLKPFSQDGQVEPSHSRWILLVSLSGWMSESLIFRIQQPPAPLLLDVAGLGLVTWQLCICRDIWMFPKIGGFYPQNGW